MNATARRRITTRIIPMVNQNALDGLQQIEIKENGNWSTVVTGVTKKMAEDIVGQAVNRTILG